MKKKFKNEKLKKGFTLIELLAVILILGIIALIAVPKITDAIENASKGAAEVSAQNYLDAFITKIAMSKLDTNISNHIKDGLISIKGVEVEIAGEVPKEGSLIIKDGKVVKATLLINGYNVMCEEQGKCKAAKDGYVYFSDVGAPTSPEGLLAERPTNNVVYIKYPKIGDELGLPYLCMFKNNTEYCINSIDNYADEELRRIYNFGPSTQHLSSEEGPGWYLIDGIGCGVEGEGFLCIEYPDAFSVNINKNVLANGDLETDLMCALYTDGFSGCEYTARELLDDEVWPARD